MEAQPHPQIISEQIVDDPLAPLRLPPLAQITEFWKRYDRAADIHDRKMTSNLNGNLDVLLIFAALFSAINTTFISITMPDLSPSPSDETNTLLRLLVMRADNNTLTPADLSPPFSPNSISIIVNCLLYASLSCSLLAAVGAMMAKEWLQSFDRTRQTGPLEEQGRLRQRKFNGVEQWHLEAVIKSLPNLLLLSVILFFAGIGLFLVPINAAVAGIVIAFSGLGAGLSSIAIVAGATSPLCPYQSAASSALRRIVKTFRDLWRTFSLYPIVGATRRRLTAVRLRTPRAVTRLSQLSGRAFHIAMKIIVMSFPALTRRNNASNGTEAMTPHHSSQRENKEDTEQIVIAQAARWLIDTTSDRGDQISTAQMIRTLDRKACALVFEDSRTWQRLLSLTREAFDAWKSQPTDRNQEIAELFGLALCHVPQLSSGIFTSESLTDLGSNQSSSLGETFLKALQLASIKYSNQELEDEECVLHVAFLHANISNDKVIQEYQWAKLARWLLVGKAPISDALLAAWAIVVWSITFGLGYYPISSGSLIELGEDKKCLARYLSNVLDGSDLSLRRVQQSSQSELSAVHCYAACLRRAGELAPQTDPEYLDQAVWGVVDLIRTYIDSLTNSGIGEISLELVGLSVEVVLGLHALIQASKRSGQKEVPVDNGPRHGPLLDDRLVKTVADLIQEDLRPSMGEEISRSSRRSIIRVLLWVWKNTPVDQIHDFWEDKIFASTCLLWAPLEKEVDFQLETQGNCNQHKPLTPKEMSGIVEFIQFIKEDRESSAFISRNADVGINRIYVHFAQRADWEYELFEVGEQSEWCSRARFIEDELL